MKNTIMPGEAFTTEEEFLAGKNTFVENGLIKATTLGNANLDNDTKEASIEGKSVVAISEGDIVLGVVTNVKESTIMIEMRRAEGDKKVTTRNAQIPVRNIANEFVVRTRDFFRIGDIVRAKVAKLSDYGIDLETKGKGLGVVSAYCCNCRQEMTPGQGKLRCLSCGSVEGRKWFENEDEYKPRARDDSRGFNDRRSFGGDRSGPHRSFGGDRSGPHRSFDNDRNGPRRSFSDNRTDSPQRSFSGERRPYNSNERDNFRGRNNETRNY